MKWIDSWWVWRRKISKSVEKDEEKIEEVETRVDGHDTEIDTLTEEVAGVTIGLDSLTQTVNEAVSSLEEGKVDVQQNVSDAGKILAIGEDGKVTPVEAPSGGYGWPDGYAKSNLNMKGSTN